MENETLMSMTRRGNKGKNLVGREKREKRRKGEEIRKKRSGGKKRGGKERRKVRK